MDVGKVVIDIGKYPASHEVKPGKRNTFYYDTGGAIKRRIIINLDASVSDTPGYKRLVYRPQKTNTMITGIAYGAGPMEEFEGSLEFCKSVAVYYWAGDITYRGPLIVQLICGYSSIYFTSAEHGGADWTKEHSSQISHNLLKWLDEENCRWNGVHIVDIAKRDGDHYICSSCYQIKVNLEYETNLEGYKKVTHTPQGGTIGRIKNGPKNVTEILITEGTSLSEVYWYPTHFGKPLIVYLTVNQGEYDEEMTFSSGIWYRKLSGNSWAKMDNGQPNHVNDADNIIEILKQAYKDTNPNTLRVHSADQDGHLPHSGGLSGGVIAGIFFVNVIGVFFLGLALWRITPTIRIFSLRRYTLL